MATRYIVFYVAPIDILKGSPRFGTPVAFAIRRFVSTATATSVQEGDEVIVFADYDPEVYGGGWKQDTYIPLVWDAGIFMRVGDEFLNLFDSSVLTTPSQVRDEMGVLTSTSS